MKKIILLVSVVYFLIAPFTYHPDTKLAVYYPTLNRGKVWNIYKYLENNKDDAPKFHYPPLHFLVLKAEWPVIKLIGGKGIENWLKIGGNVAFNDPKIYLYNLATKFPLLILVLTSGWLIYKIGLKNGWNKKVSKRAALIWLLNPLTLYSSVIMGQNDILAIFPFLIGLYYYNNLPFLAFLFFGVGGAIKSYPLIWAIVLGLIYPKGNWFKKILLTGTALMVYLITMSPYISENYYRQEVIYSGLSIRMFESAIEIGFGEQLLIVPSLLVLITLIGIKKKLGDAFESQMMVLLTVTLSVLGFTHFHPQWFLWIMPFGSFVLALSKNKWWFWSLVVSIVIIILLFGDKYLCWGLLTPVNHNLINLPDIYQSLKSRNVDVSLISNLCHSVVGGVAIYWLWLIGTRNEK